MLKIASVLLLSLALVGCSETKRDASVTTPEATAPATLQAAHDAYLAGEFGTTARNIGLTLMDPACTSAARDNALELLDATYVATNGRIPSRYKLQKNIYAMQISAQRAESAFGTERSLHFFMRLHWGVGALITEMRIDRMDGTTLIKNGMPHSTMVVTHPDAAAKDDIQLNVSDLAAFPPDGVYTLHVSMSDVPIVDTWIVLNHLESSEVPNVTVPLVTAEGEPTVQFEPFRSPEAADYESRSISFQVEERNTHVNKWTHATRRPDDLKGVVKGAPLKTGSYWLAVSAGEHRSYGPIEIERSSQRGMAFEVR